MYVYLYVKIRFSFSFLKSFQVSIVQRRVYTAVHLETMQSRKKSGYFNRKKTKSYVFFVFKFSSDIEIR